MKQLITAILLCFFFSTLSAQCISGDCVNGYGTYHYPSGNRYEGTWKNSKRDRGEFFYSNGDYFSGSFKENEKHGPGVYRYASGNRFEGMFNNGKKIEGTFFYTNGNRYVGQYENDLRNGRGTMYQPDGQVFSGYWVDNKLSDKPTSDGSSGETYVVMVGVSDYASINDLNYCDDDARALYRFLMSSDGGSVPAMNITLLLDDEATRSNILQAMRDQYSKATLEDNILFFFSGHGNVGVFAPYDIDGDTALEHEEIKKAFRDSRAGNKICFADACYSGSISSKALKETGKNQEDNAKVAVFMSSRNDELSIERPVLGQGIFTYFVVEGLRGVADANHDRQITFGELFRYVNSNVSEYTNGNQNPVMSCNDCQDAVLTRLK